MRVRTPRRLWIIGNRLRKISDLLKEKCMPQGMVLPPLFVTLGTKKDVGMEELRTIVNEAVEFVAKMLNEQGESERVIGNG